ncbi:hypothetical protein [Sphingosinicella sp. BN140058]|uniref:hypothetical protein n=1 Tax=Sphingosinicella sp. BN140058 TaxID=1892855 RepID=UPI00101057D9|nr:hypothetical protein [Sphingosinicella sp. BN140058]QAY78164.1 hypothetical protein ETR14_17740 [Sphingosinicella sp. BN140058]
MARITIMKSVAQRSAGVLLALALLTGCIRRQTADNLRYRMTVYVETSDGLRMASSVYEIDAHSNNNWVMSDPNSWTGLGCEVVGEAAGPFPGTHLFALPGGTQGATVDDYHCRLITRYLGVPNGGSAREDWRAAWKAVSKSKRQVDIESDHFPPLAEIRDFNDPMSTRLLVPTEDQPRIVRAVIEITRDKPRDRLKDILPWVVDQPTVRVGYQEIPLTIR